MVVAATVVLSLFGLMGLSQSLPVSSEIGLVKDVSETIVETEPAIEQNLYASLEKANQNMPAVNTREKHIKTQQIIGGFVYNGQEILFFPDIIEIADALNILKNEDQNKRMSPRSRRVRQLVYKENNRKIVIPKIPCRSVEGEVMCEPETEFNLYEDNMAMV